MNSYLLKTRALALLPLLFPLAFAATLTGCGGGKGADQAVQSSASSPATTRGTGQATFTIRWPQETPASRLIPKITKSILVILFYAAPGDDGKPGPEVVLERRVVPREEGKENQTVTFDNLPLDKVRVHASAYPTVDATGVAVAAGGQTLDITEEGPATIKLTMNSTLVGINLWPYDPWCQVMRYLQMVPRGGNSREENVLLSPDKLEWSSSNPAVATIDAKGLVTGLREGRTTITVRDTESGLSRSQTVNIYPESNSTTQFHPISAQFTPYMAPGGFETSGDTYVIDSDKATITDTTTGSLVAQGQLITRIQSSISTSYAVFTFAGDIHFGGGSVITGRGANPVVFLTRKNFLMDGNTKIDFSANGDTPGPGGYAVGQGPGRGFSADNYKGKQWRGGGGYAGLGGYPAVQAFAYTDYLLGGSGGAVTGAGGGGVYIASVGTFTLRDATITANGGGAPSDPANRTGGSGGSIILWSNQKLTVTRATLEAKGGAGIGASDGFVYSSGGGGLISCGYTRALPGFDGPITTNVEGGPVLSPLSSGEAGAKGRASAGLFDGF